MRGTPQAAKARGVTLYESLLDFVNCLEMVQNKEVKMTYLIFRCVLLKAFWASKIARNAPETPRTLKNTTKNKVSHLYFFILDHFQAIYEIDLKLSYKVL